MLKNKIVIPILLIFLITGCNLQGKDQTNQSDQKYTDVANTVAVQLTQLAGDKPTSTPGSSDATPTQESSADTPTNEPETNPESTNTPAPQKPSTATPIPCNWASFVKDVTYEDNTAISANTEFVKTWRLKNVGSCSWTSNYKLVFSSGDRLEAAASKQFTEGTVASGETIDISIDLKSPSDPGTYQANFFLEAPDGEQFGIGDHGNGYFYVKIVVPQPSKTPTPSATYTSTPTATTVPQADLQITELTLEPETPTQGQAVHVSVTVMNKGDAATGAFSVAWYPGENYADPACVWDVLSSNPNGGHVLTCDYAGYPSAYASINTMVIADTSNAIEESNESNNTLLKTISVSAP